MSTTEQVQRTIPRRPFASRLIAAMPFRCGATGEIDNSHTPHGFLSSCPSGGDGDRFKMLRVGIRFLLAESAEIV